MADDIGWFNIGAYHRGMMAGRTPNLDKLAAEGMLLHRLLRRSELHGRPRQLHHRRTADPHRPDHRRPGGRDRRHAGAGRRPSPRRSKPWAMPPASSARTTSATGTSSCRPCTASTSSSAISIISTRWKTRAHPNYPQQLQATRSARATWSTAGRPTWTTRPLMPRWGKVGKQKIEGRPAPLLPEGGMKTRRRRDPRDKAFMAFIDKAKADGKPFFVWLNPTRMHIVTHLSDKYRSHAQAAEWLVRSRKPAWRSSTTSSARS